MLDKTARFSFSKDVDNPVRGILRLVCMAMEEKGYDPMNQLVGYLVSGDPTYITNYNDARKLISRLDRDQVLEEIVSSYINDLAKG
jgi:uncharacterized protein (UPF0297 family)